MTAAIILALAALVFVAGAALLWRQAGQGQRRKATSVFLERQLSQASQTGESADRDTDRSPMAVVRSGIEQWDVLLRCAGIRQTPGFYIAIAGLLAAAVLLAALFAGAVSAIVAAVVVLVGVYFSIWLRADKRRQRMFDQLPEMLEAMVRLITIGNSMAAAFQAASANTNEPLREVVEKAAQLSRSTQELDVALSNVARQYDFEELQLLAAVVRVAQKYGGRSDVVLERIAAFMRDVAQARGELVAASAEIRLSAWVLALMPLGIACYIMFTNNAMFMDMWDDPLGFKMLIAALVLQAGGSYWLYRMTKSI
ncbi:type II secretion system F family protein [Bordetella genomosp. 7]|uniref:Type II secretion protein F n=1 Tax=Bordetella genomosp. 7 TaxID=1416805 RepID=A0A261QYL9_9BORD|nr:type II secretion system F family protein [Bordetella genomosp. 7]OZI17821.1 type II secretion protein F [Bordetella genomosp. 7]